MCIKLSNSQNLLWDSLETRVLLSDFAQQLCREDADVQTFTLFYLTLLVYLQLRFWNKIPLPRREESGSRSKYECQKLQRLYTQSGAACVSVHSLVKASNLAVSKVRQSFHSKHSHTKVILATGTFKRKKAFARFENGLWLIHRAYVDKLAYDNNGLKYLVVRRDLFDSTVYAKRLKTKESKITVRAV